MRTQGRDEDMEMRTQTDVGTQDSDKDMGTGLSKHCRSYCPLDALP